MFDFPEVKKFMKLARVLVVILSIFLVAESLYAFKAYTNIERSTPAMNVITVSGEGEVFALPDVATFTFGATADAKTVTDAQKKVTEKIEKALGLAKNAGVEEKDIKTLYYNVYPKYEYTNFPCTQFSCPPGKQNLTGYEVSQTISVKVRKVEDAGKILESLGATGVTDISGLQFEIDDQTKLEAEARGKAIADARAKAKVLAKDLGVRLGRVISFSESGDYPIMYRDGIQAAEVGMGGDIAPIVSKASIPAGENKIVSNVSITYEIR